MIVEDKPSIDDYILEHYGVKGMKWGVRRTQAQLDRAAGRVRDVNTKRKARDADIKKARKGAKKDRVEVNSLRANVLANRVTNGRQAALAVKNGPLKDAKAARLRNPDRANQQRLTSGEIAATAVLSGGTMTINSIAYTSLRRQGIKRQQRNLAFKDKYSSN